jgi:acyl-coenzyme A thioesterase PaaI-like protein
VKSLPHTRSCFVCGEANPSGLKLRFETDGKLVRTTFVPLPEHAGFRATVHGGVLATVLDELMVWACAVPTRRFGYCAEMTVRYANPVAPGMKILGTAELALNRKNRIFEAKAELRTESGQLLASSTGKYIPIAAELTREMVTEFVGDAEWIFGPPPK